MNLKLTNRPECRDADRSLLHTHCRQKRRQELMIELGGSSSLPNAQ